MKNLRSIGFDFASVDLLDNGIIRVVFFDKQSIGERESREINNAIGTLSGGKPARVLMVAQQNTVFDHGAREFPPATRGCNTPLATR